MNLIQQLDAVLPGWRESVSKDPLEAAVELGLIEPEESAPETAELDFHDEGANWRRYLEAHEEDE